MQSFLGEQNKEMNLSQATHVKDIFLKHQIFNCTVNSLTNRMDNSTVMSMVLRSAGNSTVLWFNYNLIMHPSLSSM